MESFEDLRESVNVLEALAARNYKVYPEEIPGIINSLYTYVGEDEGRIDEVIPVIDKVAAVSPEFKNEWYGAIEEIGGEVLEEGKIGKLASIAALALAAGISLTGCSPAPDMSIEPTPVEASVETVEPEEEDAPVTTMADLREPEKSKYHTADYRKLFKKDVVGPEAFSTEPRRIYLTFEGNYPLTADDIYIQPNSCTPYAKRPADLTFSDIIKPANEWNNIDLVIYDKPQNRYIGYMDIQPYGFEKSFSVGYSAYCFLETLIYKGTTEIKLPDRFVEVPESPDIETW